MPPIDRCPNDACPASNSAAPRHAFYWRKGTYTRRDRVAVQRYQCRHCGRHFSDQTRTPTWRRRRNDMDAPLRALLGEGVSVRSAARLLGASRKAVERRARDPQWVAGAAASRPPAPSEPASMELPEPGP